MRWLALIFWLIGGAAMADEQVLDTDWEFVADTVMGGVSSGRVEQVSHDGRVAHRLTGTVSLDNNGGFIQMAADLPKGDATGWAGIRLQLFGNSELYDIRLRTSALRRPWHSFRTEVTVAPGWQTYDIPFTAFKPHRTDLALDLSDLTRIGIVAIGRVFEADVAVAGLSFYR